MLCIVVKLDKIRNLNGFFYIPCFSQINWLKPLETYKILGFYVYKKKKYTSFIS